LPLWVFTYLRASFRSGLHAPRSNRTETTINPILVTDNDLLTTVKLISG